MHPPTGPVAHPGRGDWLWVTAWQFVRTISPWDRIKCDEGKTLGWEGKMQHYHTFGQNFTVSIRRFKETCLVPAGRRQMAAMSSELVGQGTW
ncbi:hypothetical protein M0657_010203 [Pyricularia oryzae]|nr:hypothetical protein M9X92_010287 [Pyricularia oryzae]KAI7913012.1 hypothetical protein M0657_010203 [Pyricularia oryzae]